MQLITAKTNWGSCFSNFGTVTWRGSEKNNHEQNEQKTDAVISAAMIIPQSADAT